MASALHRRALIMTLPLCSAGRTDIGKARRRNEDAILVRNEAGLWAVADGLGGHADGDYASRRVVERLASLSRAGDVFDFVEAVEDALADVNFELRRVAREREVDLIGSTVVVLVHDPAFSLCGWAGDSRGYCCSHGRLVQLTRDHLYGVAEADRWSGGPAQAQPGGGVLTRAVGADNALFMDWAVAPSRPGTRFVLCSDGVNKEMTDAEIEAACNRHAAPGDILDEIFETALQRGARDNLSAVIVGLPDGPPDREASTDEPMRALNRDLSALDDAHRLGEITRAEHRARRRRLLADLADGIDSRPAATRPSGWKRWFRRG
jgi:protein phosphatase